MRDRVFDFTPEQLRRLFWRNLSPVVERITKDGITIARHADGRFTLEQYALVAQLVGGM